MAPEEFEKLKGIGKALFGDGATLTADRRHDLANRMNLILQKAEVVEFPEPTAPGITPK